MVAWIAGDCTASGWEVAAPGAVAPSSRWDVVALPTEHAASWSTIITIGRPFSLRQAIGEPSDPRPERGISVPQIHQIPDGLGGSHQVSPRPGSRVLTTGPAWCFPVNMGEETSHPNPFAPPSEEADFSVREDSATYPLAGLGERLLGHVIDTMLVAAVCVPPFVVGVVNDSDLSSTSSAAAMLLGCVLGLSLQAYQWYLVATSGQTLAKRWLKMKIVRENGESVGFVTGVLLRSWVLLAAGMIPFVGSFVGFTDAVAIFFGERRQTLHDRIASTLVVRIDGGRG
jgi:uncharacterized RDD family membrane protein YckC